MTGDRMTPAGQALADLDDAIAGARAIIEGITPGQWGEPTPCTGIDVRGLVNHLVAGNRYFVALARGTARPDGDADLLGDDPAAAFRTAAAGLTAALGAPGVLDRTYPLPFGEVPGGTLIEIRLIEHLGHGWDLAKATVGRSRWAGRNGSRPLTAAEPPHGAGVPGQARARPVWRHHAAVGHP